MGAAAWVQVAPLSLISLVTLGWIWTSSCPTSSLMKWDDDRTSITGSGWGLNEFLDVKVQDCTWPIVFAVLLLLCPLHFIMNDLEHTEKANKLYSKPPYNYHQWFHQEHFTVCVLSHLYASMSLSQWILILMHFRVMAIVYMSLYFLKQLSTVSLNSMCIKLVLSFPLTSWVLWARWNSSGRGGGGEAGSSWPWK